MHQAQTPIPPCSNRTESASLNDLSGEIVKHQPMDTDRVSQSRLDHSLTDSEREAAIKCAGSAMEAAYASYQQSGCFSDLGRAHHLLMQMGKLIEGRSPEQVARMEQERGLA